MEQTYILVPGAYVRHLIYAHEGVDGTFTCYVDLEVGRAVQRTRCLIIHMDRATVSFDIRVLDGARPYWYGYPSETDYVDAVTRKVLGFD